MKSNQRNTKNATSKIKEEEEEDRIPKPLLNNEQDRQEAIEHLAKTLFLQIDPILRLLLCVLNSYQKREYLKVVVVRSSSSSPYTSSASSMMEDDSSSSQRRKQQKQHEQHLGMLQMQAKLLDRFQSALLAFVQQQQPQQQQQQQQQQSAENQACQEAEASSLLLSSTQHLVAQSMLLVMEYMVLPLLTILRMSHDDDDYPDNATPGLRSDDEHGNDDDSNIGGLAWKGANLKSSPKDWILQSAIYKVWTKTAVIIQWIVATITISSSLSSLSSSQSSSLSSDGCCCLTLEMQIQLLVAVASVLPSGKQIQAQAQQQQLPQEHLLATTFATTSRLDRGEDCISALLQTLQVLLIRNVTTDHNSPTKDHGQLQLLQQQYNIPHILMFFP